MTCRCCKVRPATLTDYCTECDPVVEMDLRQHHNKQAMLSILDDLRGSAPATEIKAALHQLEERYS